MQTLKPVLKEIQKVGKPINWEDTGIIFFFFFALLITLSIRTASLKVSLHGLG
jgi:hypothetical protein